MDKDFPRVEVANRAEWRHWLFGNHSSAGSIWLVTWRKHCADKHLGYDAIVEEALCFGWIDSLPRRLDADRTMLLLSPRKPKSGWSAINKTRIERMIAAGAMQPAGLAAIASAKASGAWSLLDGVDALENGPDLVAAFARRPGSQALFDAFPPSVRRGILEWIRQAKTEATRARRIETTAEMAARNERANQFRKR